MISALEEVIMLWITLLNHKIQWFDWNGLNFWCVSRNAFRQGGTKLWSFKDGNKIQPANPKKEVQAIFMDQQQASSKDPLIIFLSFELTVPHGRPLWSGSPSWQLLSSWSDVSIPTSIFTLVIKSFWKCGQRHHTVPHKSQYERGAWV